MARQVANMMFQMRKEMDTAEQSVWPEIDAVLLLDRDVDLVTPLLLQLTYEGLIDEAFGITGMVLRLPADLVPVEKKEVRICCASRAVAVTQQPTTATQNRLLLSSAEPLYETIRSMNFADVPDVLSERARQQQQQQQRSKAELSSRQLSELHSAVKRVAASHLERYALTLHLAIREQMLQYTTADAFAKWRDAEQAIVFGENAELANEYIMECIAKKVSGSASRLLRRAARCCVP